MFIYEKNVEGVRKLFGAKENVPSENDAELVFKDTNGNVLTLAENDTYLDDGHGGIFRKSDGKPVIVFFGDDEEAFIPKGLVIKKATKKTTKVSNEEPKNTTESVEETKETVEEQVGEKE